MSGVDYSRTLTGLSINLLVADVEAGVRFGVEVVGAQVVYSDLDFAVPRHGSQEWMLHADHTYEEHPFAVRTREASSRGAGVELRIHGRSPDEAAKAAIALGCEVLDPPTNKGHGMRETYILDPDGYTWVVDEYVGPAEA
jgi:catechol 2,3-dioxygenase-like lactoylglutathione lyase family enzyme